MNIGVIGAGISGLSTAFVLNEAGHTITILAKDFSANIVSYKAAAFWFPYHIRNDKRAIEWCKQSYTFFKRHSADTATGISMIPLLKVAKKGENDPEEWLDFMPENSYTLLPENELPYGYAIGYKAIVPLIETQIFLPWLSKQLKNLGVQFIEKEVNDLNTISHQFDIIINCTALGSKVLCNDETIIPVRGQVALLQTQILDYIFLDNQSPTYVVPRKDATIIGGTYEENIHDAITEEKTLEMLVDKASSILPALQNKKRIGDWAGLRPFRPMVRLEQEGKIIHNYGHGGSGYTLSFGCAREVQKIIATHFKQIK